MAVKVVSAAIPGIFYRRAAPDAPAFKSNGDKVTVGDTLGIIEVMKTFSPIVAEEGGVFVIYLVEDGDAVDADTPLCELKLGSRWLFLKSIANRGEIAVRINRAARELGLSTLQVMSAADHGMLAVKLADEAIEIGPAHSSKSYLNGKAIVDAASFLWRRCYPSRIWLLIRECRFC